MRTPLLVGIYDEQDLANGKDKQEVAEAMDKTGMKYTETKVIRKKGKPYLKIWLISSEEYYNSRKI